MTDYSKAYRNDFSDASAKVYPRRELVLSKRKYTQPAAQSLFLYSAYNAAFWTVDTAADAGALSLGCYLDKNRVSIALDGTVTPNGEQTWTGTGTLRSTSATNVSTYTNVVVSLELGAYELGTTQSLTIAGGFCHSDGTDKQEVKSLTWNHPGRFFFTIPVANITSTVSTAVYVYFTITPATADGQWWAMNMQLESGTTPGEFVETAGAAVTYATDQKNLRTIAKIHPSEWELVQEEYEGKVFPREGQDQSSYVNELGDV